MPDAGVGEPAPSSKLNPVALTSESKWAHSAYVLETSASSIITENSLDRWPAWLLSGTFLGSTAIAPRGPPSLPPLVFRLGFSFIFAGAGYVTSTGDIRNGNGITTAWSLIYLFLNARNSLRRPWHPVGLGLTVATSLCAGIYGENYFQSQNFLNEKTDS
ncbi:hypothetical protein SISNIDRAFT_489428 [Sistotremastrum niveocremeum HHB9708]|uniref:Uncharacterized protein n=1 Tax=Sistotremastrum niveocremeum HHB9708 TaxID=1314777 RepID=A0A164Q0R3_9AGAM|nr:hypothetical protein SISNIDRAFT_489428 [Sistotremastrum niveocremeum HHB9708]